MPKANKIRVTNVRMDSSSRVIGDKTWDLFGNNSIFLLENGGGKTSIIHLLHQVVLPNHTIQKRRMINSVNKKSPRHIAVEWVPDDESYPNFVTGFCFHNFGYKQKDSDHTYGYFNYIFEYDEGSGLTLGELPFTQDGTVTGLGDLKNELKDTPGVHLFDSNKEYKEALEQYGLLESEWRNIAKVNDQEGGVTEFFTSTNKTVTLIERLLIPSLTESIYETPEEQNAILASFKKYKSGLLELPELEKDLQDFEVIFDHSDPIIDSFEQLEETIQDLEVAKENLTKLYVTVSKRSSDNKEEMEHLENRISALVYQGKILNWKLDSHQVHLLNKENERQVDQMDDYEKDKERLINEQCLTKNNIEEQRAAKAYEKYKEHNRQMNNYRSQLEVAKLDAEKQHSEFLKARKAVSQKHKYLFDELMKTRNEKKEALDKVEKGLTDNQSQLKLQEKETSKLEKSIVRLEAMIEQYGKEKLTLQHKVGDLWEVNVSRTCENVKGKIDKLKAHLNDQKDKLTAVDDDFNKSREGIIELDNVIPSTEKELEHVEEKFDQYAKEETGLQQELASTINFSVVTTIFEAKDIIDMNLVRRKEEFQNEHTKKSVLLDHMVQLKNGIEQKGYHVHPEIEEVKEFLVQKNTSVISGVEWITNSTSSELEKKELLKRNPMLSFSILAESGQMNEVRNDLKLFKKELTVPIIFLDRLQLDVQAEKADFYPLGENVFVFNQFSTRLTPEDWEAYAAELEETIEVIKSEVSTLTHKLNEVSSLAFKLENFFNQFDKFSRETFSKQVQQLEREMVEKTTERQMLTDHVERLATEKVQIEQNMNEISIKISRHEAYQLHVQTFIDRYVAIEDDFKQLEIEKQKLASILEVIHQLKEEEQQYMSDQQKIQQDIEGMDVKKINYDRDFKEYNYELAEESIITNVANYEKTKSYYNQLRSENSVEQSQMNNLQQSLNNYNQLVKESIEEIKKNNFTVEVLEKTHLNFDERLLNQLELDLDMLYDHLKDLETNIAVLQNNEEKTKENLRKELAKIAELYAEINCLEPYEYGQDAESEYQLHQRERESIIYKREKFTHELEDIRNDELRIQTALEELERREELFVQIHHATPFEDEEWSSTKPMDDVHKYSNAIENKQRLVQKRERTIQENIWKLRDDAQKTGNHHLIHSIGQFIKIFEGENYDETIESFYKMLEGIEGYSKSLEARKKHSDESRSELIEQMYQRAEVIHKNIVDIAKSSQIEDGGEILHLIHINWPKNEYNHVMHQLRTFVNSVLHELTELKKNGAPEKEIDHTFDKLASVYNIVNCYADVTKCNIRVLKPRNELLAMNKEYANWDSIEADWSGGERQIARISMFISFLNHLRKARFAKEMSWKFLIFDNPFDKMQSEHVVRPMVELAKRTKTQLLCFTGVNDNIIQKEFDTIISNEYIQQHGKLLLSSETEHKKDQLGLNVLSYAK